MEHSKHHRKLLRTPTLSSSKKKIGLALGGGGARGLAHIGVIKALQDAGVEISFIAGTSMGALVGGWVAAGKDIKIFESAFLSVTSRDMLPFRGVLGQKTDHGPFKDGHIIDSLVRELHGIKIEDCPIPFAAIATDMKTGDEVRLMKGDLIEAVRASAALPIVFPPKKLGELFLIDGGFVNPVPADVAREMGAEFVIAVDVSSLWPNFSEEKGQIRNLAEAMSHSLEAAEYQLARRPLQSADIVLKPIVLSHNWLDFAAADSIIPEGYREAKRELSHIKKGAGYAETPKTLAETIMDFIFYGLSDEQ